MEALKTSCIRTPGNVAVVNDSVVLTYDQFHRQTNQAAHFLREKRIQRGDVVALGQDRSLEALIFIYGILKAGGVYLPVATDFPDQRVEYILSNSEAKLLICHTDHRTRFQNFSNVETHSFDLTVLESYSDAEPDVDLSPTDLAYIIYTSGSTGTPKGVMVDHQALSNRIGWMQNHYNFSEHDVFLHKTPLIFDVSLWEVFLWSLSGARVVVLPQKAESFPPAIIHTISNHQVTVAHFIPSMLSVFLEYLAESDHEKLKSLTRLFLSGEAFTPHLLEKFNTTLCRSNGTEITNLYGPTEAAIDVTFFDCPKSVDLSVIPIGRPIENIRTYVLDENQTVVGDGEKGELCLAGIGLARGYINNKLLTEEKFIHHSTLQERLYQTGDIVEVLENGMIHYIGRNDDQIKIRGMRIELGEIEGQIYKSNMVDQCCVLLKNKSTINSYIVAFVCFKNGFDETCLKAVLAVFLPDYMMPRKIVALPKLPTLFSGKLDQKSLLEMEID